jgi:hypothetical protein
MGFLDNLESNLKNLEGNTERDTGRQKQQKDSDRANARAAAPYAEELRKGAFTNDLLTHAVRVGHGMRTKVNMNWMGNVLLLQARERRLELRPTPQGVVAVFFEDGEQVRSEPIDLKKDSAKDLAEQWLG